MINSTKIARVDNWFLINNQKMNQLEKLVSNQDVTFSQYVILLHLFKKDCSTPTELSQITKTSKSSISRALKRLQSKELIAKKYGDENDQRVVYIENTLRGNEVVRDVGLVITNSNLSFD